MKKILPIFFFSLLLFQNVCFAQFKKQLERVTHSYNIAASDSDKVVALGKLADLYYTYQLYRQGDSILQKQFRIADMADNNNLMLLALFGTAVTNVGDRTSTNDYNKTVIYIQKGIDYAKSQNLNNYVALGYIRMSVVLRKRGQTEKALYNATQALQLLPTVKSDSIQAMIYIELGNAYVARSEAVSAVRNFNNALDIALKIRSVPLQSQIFHCFFEMYFVSIKNNESAKYYVKKSKQLDEEHNYVEGLIKDYYDLSRVTDEKYYLEKSIALSDSFHSYKYILDAKILQFYYYFVVEKSVEKSFQYLETEPEVKASFINPGPGTYNRMIGWIYLYSGIPDTALTYFKLAEYDFIQNFDERLIRGLFKEIADCYQILNDAANSIAYNMKVLNISKKLNDVAGIAKTSNTLSVLYASRGNYKQAFDYSTQAKIYNDSVAQLSKARDMALLENERENLIREDQLRQIATKENNKRNVQYLAITIAICVIFIGMLIMGTFPISKLTIKMFGYFFFISLFEFIVLLIDNIFLAKAVHGEPLKLWLVKIVLIALLVPLQHYMEHTLIKFLQSRKLLEARTKFSMKKFWTGLKKPTPVNDDDIEEDTAVL